MIKNYKEIKFCRICHSNNLINVLSLGTQCLTGIFPKKVGEKITKGPLELVWCQDCTLLQMKQSYSLVEMYGSTYGYRSGLNLSMSQHLKQKIKFLEDYVKLKKNDLIIDIGSNDGTLLNACNQNLIKVGVDPLAKKFKKFYKKNIYIIPEFFSYDKFNEKFPNKKAKLITSIAMFYDLEDPRKFVEDVFLSLEDEGIWHFEQSYMPSMLRTNAYDTICHEHLEFYSFKVVKNLVESCGLRVVDVEMNSINGGSFAVSVSKKNAKHKSNKSLINWMLKQEKDMGLDTIEPYKDFEKRVYLHRENLKGLINALVSTGGKIAGYGASTKGNVLLQFCNIGKKQIPFIADVNKDKFGAYTPGSSIPIVSEKELFLKNPDYLLVLPWHFKHGILQKEKKFVKKGGKFIFPLPEIEIV